MVAVVQLVEHQVVILDVAGSSPVSHPTKLATSDVGVARFPLLPRNVPVAKSVGARQGRSHGVDDLDDVAALRVFVEPDGVARADVEAAVARVGVPLAA